MSLPGDTLYTGSLYVAIPSSGTYVVDRRVPDLLLTVYYRQDPKTGDLVPGYTKFLVQTNGRVTANLLLPDSDLTTTTVHRVCSFRLRVNYEFGRAIREPYEVSILENPALEATQDGAARRRAGPPAAAAARRALAHSGAAGGRAARGPQHPGSLRRNHRAGRAPPPRPRRKRPSRLMAAGARLRRAAGWFRLSDAPLERC